ncbi:MAG: aminomethyl-transferring glycine dehydrogenase subunit GcvPB, partial [Tissierellia bacterium]|nr:aminomethyl-transferring glycine dehydrogenase subunit GcvPB [Tissierellia bacterium]
MRKYNELIFELSKPGRIAHRLPENDVQETAIEELIPSEYLNDDELDLPEVSEIDIIRHYTNLSNKNFGVDTGFYPLGSCTMKYNPKINEDMAALNGFVNLHPLQPEETVQGALRLMYELDEALCAVSGMDKMTLQPAAGAHGELTGLTLIKAYHE